MTEKELIKKHDELVEAYNNTTDEKERHDIDSLIDAVLYDLKCLYRENLD